jgi:phenylalanyl-tRNA synthetase beta subunit
MPDKRRNSRQTIYQRGKVVMCLESGERGREEDGGVYLGHDWQRWISCKWKEGVPRQWAARVDVSRAVR